MKRRLVMMLTAVMITSLTACGSPSGDTNVNDKESKVEDTVAATEQAEEPESEVAESETIDTEVLTEDTETTETEQESETEEEKKVEKSEVMETGYSVKYLCHYGIQCTDDNIYTVAKIYRKRGKIRNDKSNYEWM